MVGRGGRVQVTWEVVEAEGSRVQDCPQTLRVVPDGSERRLARRPGWARVSEQPPAKEQRTLESMEVTIGALVKLILTA